MLPNTLEPKYLLIVKTPAGLSVLDTPRPLGQGAVRRRAEAKGATLYAYDILTFEGGVRYALLVPREPGKPEWVRVAEAGSIIPEYVEIKELSAQESSSLSLDRLANAIDRLAIAIAGLKS